MIELFLSATKYTAPAVIFAAPLVALLLPTGVFFRRILTFSVPLPVFVILGGLLFGWLNQQNAVVKATRETTQKLVAGAELEAAEKTVRAKNRVIAEMIRAADRASEIRAADAAAEARLAEHAREMAEENRILKDELNALLTKDTGSPSVGRDLFNRLRNAR